MKNWKKALKFTKTKLVMLVIFVLVIIFLITYFTPVFGGNPTFFEKLKIIWVSPFMTPKIECTRLDQVECLDHQNICALCPRVATSSYDECHTKYFCSTLRLHTPSECDEFKGSDKDACLFNLGIGNDASSFCDRMTNVSFKNPCYQQIAMTTDNPSLCAKVENKPYMEKDVCYGNIATTRKDVSMCEDIESSDYKTLCISVIKQDVSMCNNIQEVNIKSLCKEANNETLMGVRSAPIFS